MTKLSLFYRSVSILHTQSPLRVYVLGNWNMSFGGFRVWVLLGIQWFWLRLVGKSLGNQCNVLVYLFMNVNQCMFHVFLVYLWQNENLLTLNKTCVCVFLSTKYCVAHRDYLCECMFCVCAVITLWGLSSYLGTKSRSQQGKLLNASAKTCFWLGLDMQWLCLRLG